MLLAMRSLCAALLACCTLGVAQAATVEVRDLRLWASPDSTRVVLDLSGEARYKLFTLANPDRVVVDLERASWNPAMLKLPAPSGHVRSVRFGAPQAGTLRVVLDLAQKAEPRGFLTPPNESYGHRLVIDLGAAAAANPRPQPVKPPHAQNAQRDLVIAVDAGHGGEDPGAVGRGGTREKDITLRVARLLAERINAEPGMRAVLTRTGDYFVPLRERIRRARVNQADMFISVHADAFVNRSVRGSSVYILSQRRASNEATRWLAERENAADLIGGVSLDDKNSVLASVLLDLSQNAAISASRDAAHQVLRQLDRVGDLKRSEVQFGSFAVLTAPDIPSMLVETAFISNPDEERRLRDPAHQKRLADAIHAGVRQYFYDNPPAGTRVAQLAAQQRGRTVKHVVAPGESLADVAGRYAVSLESLQQVNGIVADGVAAGMVLDIPSSGG
jgi:N-acetylmuramoyl-L-alanine amidase